MTENIYQAQLMAVEAITQETPDIKTFRLAFQDSALRWKFRFTAGQFGIFSVFGYGEAPFGLANPPTHGGYVECSMKRVGKVTGAFHDLKVGDTVGFRGPYGTGFPIDQLKGKSLVFVGGGIGMAPLRSLIGYCFDSRQDYGDITIIYGARSTTDLVYKQELHQWQEMQGVRTVLTVDPGGADAGWRGRVGYVPTILEEEKPSPHNAVAITCGPPIMIKLVIAALTRMGFAPEQIVTTLESKMTCGMGKCGRCNIGPAYVCKHGPVFRYDELKQLPGEY